MIVVPQVRAQTFRRLMREARTRPGLFSCRSEDGQYQDYVVKFHGQLESRIVCEFMAALLGQYLGLPIPPIAIVTIDPGLTAILDPETQKQVGIGPHFGSLLRTGGFATIPRGFPIHRDSLPQALDVFAFDMLIQNPDRSNIVGEGKANVLHKGSELVIFDHELAFSSLREIGGPSSPPWELRGLPFPRNHVFYPQLRSYLERNPSFERFISRLTTLSDSVLNEMATAVPESWRSSTEVDTMTERITEHLRTVRDNIDRFEHGLREVFVT